MVLAAERHHEVELAVFVEVRRRNHSVGLAEG